MTTTTDWIEIDDAPPLDDVTLWQLARTEYVRMLSLLRSLDDEDWLRPTDCPPWTVRDMLGHLVGAAEGFSSPVELIHQVRLGARFIADGRSGGKETVDGANAVQIAERADRQSSELLARYEAVIEPVLRWRRRLRHLPGRMKDVAGSFTFRELAEIILTRDTWMHRVDIARATGRPFQVTADHDGLIVADGIREWARRHRSSFRLRLTGPAGGAYCHGEGGVNLELEAVEFARLLSGRGLGSGLLATRIVF